MEAYCLGIDAHKDNLTLSLTDREGKEVWKRKTAGSRAGLRHAMEGLLRTIGGDTSVHAGVEASRSHFWVDEELQGYCHQGWIEQAGVVQSDLVDGIRKRGKKSDWRDANEIADLMRCGRARWVYMPPEPYATLRLLSRDRLLKVHKTTRCQNRMWGILARHGIQWPWRNLLGIRSRKQLSSVPVRAAEAQEIGHLMEEIELLERQVRTVEEGIGNQLKKIPEAQLLLEIPGMGQILVAMILGEIGDLRRFRNGHEAAAFTGVVPRSLESGGVQRGVGITHRGNRILRTALVSAAMMVSRYCLPFRENFKRRSRRLKKYKARMANTRSLIMSLHAMVVRNERFKYLPAEPKTSPSRHPSGVRAARRKQSIATR